MYGSSQSIKICSTLPFEKGKTPVLSVIPWIPNSTTIQNVVTIAIVSITTTQMQLQMIQTLQLHSRITEWQ
jgi:hypothetical protein